MTSQSSHGTQEENETKVRSWGFDHVFTWTDKPNAHYPPHSHSGPTTHLILDGSLTIAFYPEKTKTTTLGVGERFDVEAGRMHEVWVGARGCTYVIGE